MESISKEELLRELDERLTRAESDSEHAYSDPEYYRSEGKRCALEALIGWVHRMCD